VENKLRRKEKEWGWLNLLSEEIYKNIRLYAKKPNNIEKMIKEKRQLFVTVGNNDDTAKIEIK